MSRKLMRGTGVLAAALAVLSTANPAFAHEERQVGAYQLTVGWRHEPTFTGQLNSVQFFVKDAKGKPIDDLGDPPSLQVTVTTGIQTSNPLDVKASFDPDTGLGAHGEFDADIVPTTPGTYTFHLTGTINGQKIDEKFTSSDKTFDDVKDPSDVQFPSKVPNTADLATNLTRLSPRVDKALALGKSAHDKANSDATLAVVALIVGGVLGLGGIVVGLTGRRRKA
ncbi:MAG TPA: hypothetical protein VKI64_09960 [Acidimicrobiales bacterium]|nr:hypothetical protein [Acidimicrobiales bacterium]